MKSTLLETVIVIGSLLVLLAIIVMWPLLFAAMTLLLSIVLFGSVERDKLLHDMSFYTRRPLSPQLIRFFTTWSYAEVLVKSALCGALPLFLFGGTNEARVSTLGLIFVLSVAATYLVLRRVEALAGVDILRWGYLRLSLLAGIVFSLIASVVPGIPLKDIALSIGRSTFSQLGFSEIIELTYGLLYQINSFVSDALVCILGPLGWIISLVLTVHVVYGVIVLLYALLLIRMLAMPSTGSQAANRD